MAQRVDGGDEEVERADQTLAVLDEALLRLRVVGELLLQLRGAVRQVVEGIAEGCLRKKERIKIVQLQYLSC